MRPPQISFFAYYIEAPSDQIFRLLCGGPPLVNFFAYCVGAPLYKFFAYYMGAPSDQFLRLLHGGGGGAIRSVSLVTIWGPPQINFFAYYVGAPSDQFICILYGGGGGASCQFSRLLYGIFTLYRICSLKQFIKSFNSN